MNNFLQLSKSVLSNLANYQKIYVVLGNESCDLDSAISSIIYAYFLYNQEHNCAGCQTPVLPILNIHENEFPLRTETKYFLQKLNINVENLIFRNLINLTDLSKENKLKIILVDHHVLPVQDKDLEKNVNEVVDHRPVDKNSNWKNIDVTINTVGSCTTLIADKIYKQNSSILDDTIGKLLHGTIVLDTVNFNVSANRFTDLDVEIVTKLEKDFNITYSRDQIYNELTSARSDVSALTPFQILHRDMKIINSVPFPGVPMLVSEFLELPGAKESLKEFCQAKKCKVIVPMGLTTKDNKVFRDIGVYSIQNSDLKNELLEKLSDSKYLCLKEVNINVEGLVLFSQGNVKASRKHIVPILSPVIAQNKSGNDL